MFPATQQILFAQYAHPEQTCGLHTVHRFLMFGHQDMLQIRQSDAHWKSYWCVAFDFCICYYYSCCS